jgi:acetyl-CoA synthetase
MPLGLVDALLKEERVFRPQPQVVREANLGPEDYDTARRICAKDFRQLWETEAQELDWFTKWTQVLDDSNPPFYKWFTGGRCNLAHNALDRHILTANKNKLAVIWEGESGECRKYTYYELYREVNRFANALRTLGVGKGDRVLLYLPPLPETVIAMLTAAKIGAVQTLVFAGYSAKSLRERVESCAPKVIVTADGFYRNGRVINLKTIVDQALMGLTRTAPENVIVVHRTGLDSEMFEPRDLRYEDLVRQERTQAATEVLEAEDPLFLLYTSGATGKPKGLVHTHGGYMVGVHATYRWVMDVKPTDIYFCTADPGWITGHSYVVFGPLMAGTTVVLYEGHPLYPQADRVWSIVARYGVTILYTTPTLIRMLMRYGPQYPKRHDLSTLRLLGSVGEPIGPEPWIWFHKYIGREECPVLDTWWQTETGMFMVSPLPISLLKPGSAGKPLPGVDVDVVDSAGQPAGPDKGGFVVIRQPWPAMARTLWKDEPGYKKTYWERIPGVYFTGDMARKDEDGYFWFQGRADDVLNIGGLRIGSAEVEAALTAHRYVVEAAVIGVPDSIRGEAAKAFVVPIEGWENEFETEDEFMTALNNQVHRELGPFVTLRSIGFRDSLPHTNSGKIMRRLLKAEELGTPPGDLSSLEEE